MLKEREYETLCAECADYEKAMSKDALNHKIKEVREERRLRLRPVSPDATSFARRKGGVVLVASLESATDLAAATLCTDVLVLSVDYLYGTPSQVVASLLASLLLLLITRDRFRQPTSRSGTRRRSLPSRGESGRVYAH